MAAKQTHWVLTTAPAWIPDEEVTSCDCCKADFSFFKRKVTQIKFIFLFF